LPDVLYEDAAATRPGGSPPRRLWAAYAAADTSVFAVRSEPQQLVDKKV
jgi:hypothetical protein